MHVLYVHQNFPAQFGHIAHHLVEKLGWRCSFVSETPAGNVGGYRAMKARPDIRPDLIVGHSGFGSTLFLRELYPEVPVINFFEYYYHPHDPDSDMDFRKDLEWVVPEVKYLRSRCRNSMILLDLQNCQ